MFKLKHKNKKFISQNKNIIIFKTKINTKKLYNFQLVDL